MKKKRLLELSRRLRKNMTEAEKLLWWELRNKKMGVKFRRQQPLGKYIVDFVAFERKIIIEIDGSQHLNNSKDIERDRYFKKRGYRILRFWNNKIINNTEGVLKVIREEILK